MNKKTESIARQRYGHAIGQFVFCRFEKKFNNDKDIVRRIGILYDIFDDTNVLRLKHRDKEIFWDIPALDIIEFEAEPLKGGKE